jgi:hypothetical protein
MIVDIVLAAISAAVLAAVIWALTRPAGRIQLASVCLFVCAAFYLLVATKVYEFNTAVGALVGAYALLIYAVVAALAILQKRWAWKAAIAAFGIHGMATILGLFAALHAGNPGWAALLLSLCVAVVGMYASLHKGSRQLVSKQHASAA